MAVLGSTPQVVEFYLSLNSYEDLRLTTTREANSKAEILQSLRIITASKCMH